MNEETAKAIANAVVEWLVSKGKISEQVYGRMSMDGDGPDVEALAAVVQQTYNE